MVSLYCHESSTDTLNGGKAQLTRKKKTLQGSKKSGQGVMNAKKGSN